MSPPTDMRPGQTRPLGFNARLFRAELEHFRARSIVMIRKGCHCAAGLSPLRFPIRSNGCDVRFVPLRNFVLVSTTPLVSLSPSWANPVGHSSLPRELGQRIEPYP